MLSNSEDRISSFTHLNFAKAQLDNALGRSLVDELQTLGLNKRLENVETSLYEQLTCDEFLVYSLDYHGTELAQFSRSAEYLRDPVFANGTFLSSDCQTHQDISLPVEMFPDLKVETNTFENSLQEGIATLATSGIRKGSTMMTFPGSTRAQTMIKEA